MNNEREDVLFELGKRVLAWGDDVAGLLESTGEISDTIADLLEADGRLPKDHRQFSRDQREFFRDLSKRFTHAAKPMQKCFGLGDEVAGLRKKVFGSEKSTR